jgi:hypothetical protein
LELWTCEHLWTGMILFRCISWAMIFFHAPWCFFSRVEISWFCTRRTANFCRKLAFQIPEPRIRQTCSASCLASRWGLLVFFSLSFLVNQIIEWASARVPPTPPIWGVV